MTVLRPTSSTGRNARIEEMNPCKEHGVLLKDYRLNGKSAVGGPLLYGLQLVVS